MDYNLLNNEFISDDDDNDDNEGEETITNSLKKYIEPKILENINLNSYFLPSDIQISNNKLKITNKGIYSISKPDDAEWITNAISNFIQFHTNYDTKLFTITDATAGIGGNTISFARRFFSVCGIEINEIHYNVLKNNISCLGLENVHLFHDNFLTFIENNKMNSEIFFLDPPWGGKSYKKFKYFNLKLGKIPIYNIINILFDKNYKYVVLKGPINLNVSPIIHYSKYENFQIYKNMRGNMLLIIFY